MQNVHVPVSHPSWGTSSARRSLEAVRDGFPGVLDLLGDQQFIEMLNAYRPSGGLARADEVLSLFHCGGGNDVSTLARWIVERRIVCFEWQSDLWLPLFQFNRADMSPRSQVSELLRLLNPACCPWDTASWFVRPHPLLAGRTPVEALGEDFAAVLQAAQADRADASIS